MILVVTTVLTLLTSEPDSSRLELYDSHLENLDHTKIENIQIALSFFNQLSEHPADSVNDKMFELFRDYYFRTIRHLNSDYKNFSKIYEYDDWYSNPYTDSLTKELNIYGIDLFSTEGSFYASQKVGYLSDVFSDKLTKAYSEFINRRDKEMRVPFSEDAILLISFNSVANRMIYWEKFLRRYPDSHISESAYFFYEHYLGALIAGTDNSKVYDRNTKRFHDKIIQLYELVISNDPNSNSAQIINGYLEKVKQNDFIFNNSVQEYIKINNLPSLLHVQPIPR